MVSAVEHISIAIEVAGSGNNVSASCTHGNTRPRSRGCTAGGPCLAEVTRIVNEARGRVPGRSGILTSGAAHGALIPITTGAI